MSTGLFALPPGAPFAEAFARGFHARYGHLDPLETARVQVLVNTSLARQTLEEALADTAPGPVVLPRMVLMSEFHADPLRATGTPLSVAPIRRRLRLTRLVERFLAANLVAGDRIAPGTMAADLAEALALLIDQFHDEGISPDKLDDALGAEGLSGDPARHWEATLRFVDIVRQHWPAILDQEEAGRIDARARQRATVEAQLATWEVDKPEHPIIAAASTGSVGSTAELLAGVARLPLGAVVLPGFDPETPSDIWTNVEPDHPLGPFRRLFELLEATPSDAALWHGEPAGSRAQLFAQVLRPAPVTDHWHKLKHELAAFVPEACAGLTLLNAESPQEEAGAIAMAIRCAIDDPDRSVALVTPDAALARRVTASLEQFQLVPDDTTGQPLFQSPPGILLRLVAELATKGCDPVGLAALMNHPLVQPEMPRADHLTFARAYEREVLRAQPWPLSPTPPPWPDAPEPAAAWHANLSKRLTTLADALSGRPLLATQIRAHMDALEALTRPDPEAPPDIWADDAGQSLHRALVEIADAADAYGETPPPDYPSLLRSLMSGEQIRPKPRESHPRVSITGPREARLISADLVILAGLEDGTWPALPDPGPWVSRPMRATIGLPAPERSVGLSAHDFLHAACGREVILSHARKRDGAATVASRWLIRMETLIKGIGCEPIWDEMLDRGARWCAMARRAAQPAQRIPRASPPAPSPPVSARPRRLSVTGIETLVRDPYAVYARQVLRLYPLDPLGRTMDARDRGNVLHEILEQFVEATRRWPGREAARVELERVAEAVLADRVPMADLRGAWRARLGRVADWFIAAEDARRIHANPIATERQGRRTINLSSGPFEITAKADRIDLDHTGAGLIYDYKTGQPPSQKEIDAGFNHQLHVQAWILAGGGFDGLQPAPAGGGAYIGLTGSGDGGVERGLPNLPAELVEHMERAVQLLAAYDTDMPYRSQIRPQTTRFVGDYDHLARRAEWSEEDQS